LAFDELFNVKKEVGEEEELIDEEPEW